MLKLEFLSLLNAFIYSYLSVLTYGFDMFILTNIFGIITAFFVGVIVHIEGWLE